MSMRFTAIYGYGLIIKASEIEILEKGLEMEAGTPLIEYTDEIDATDMFAGEYEVCFINEQWDYYGSEDALAIPCKKSMSVFNNGYENYQEIIKEFREKYPFLPESEDWWKDHLGEYSCVKCV